MDAISSQVSKRQLYQCEQCQVHLWRMIWQSEQRWPSLRSFEQGPFHPSVMLGGIPPRITVWGVTFSTRSRHCLKLLACTGGICHCITKCAIVMNHFNEDKSSSKTMIAPVWMREVCLVLFFIIWNTFLFKSRCVQLLLLVYSKSGHSGYLFLFNLLDPGIFKWNFRLVGLSQFSKLAAEVSLVKLPQADCHYTSPMISHHWFS